MQHSLKQGLGAVFYNPISAVCKHVPGLKQTVILEKPETLYQGMRLMAVIVLVQNCPEPDFSTWFHTFLAYISQFLAIVEKHCPIPRCCSSQCQTPSPCHGFANWMPLGIRVLAWPKAAPRPTKRCLVRSRGFLGRCPNGIEIPMQTVMRQLDLTISAQALNKSYSILAVAERAVNPHFTFSNDVILQLL